jgi:hypothetical protein
MYNVIVGEVVDLGGPDPVWEKRVELPGPCEVHATIALSATAGGEFTNIESYRYLARNGKVANAVHRKSFLAKEYVTSILFRLQRVNPPPGRGANPVATYTILYRLQPQISFRLVAAGKPLTVKFARKDD